MKKEITSLNRSFNKRSPIIPMTSRYIQVNAMTIGEMVLESSLRIIFRRFIYLLWTIVYDNAYGMHTVCSIPVQFIQIMRIFPSYLSIVPTSCYKELFQIEIFDQLFHRTNNMPLFPERLANRDPKTTLF